MVSAPTGSDGVTSPMREVDTNTFFTNTKSITLDSIYFQSGSRVQCAARAFNANGDAGLELSSSIFVISKEEGERRADGIKAEYGRLVQLVHLINFNTLQVCVSLVSRGLLELNLSLLRSDTQARMTLTSLTSSN